MTSTILPGTSIHGINLLLSCNGKPSLADLKQYDRRSGWPEVSHMKTLAHSKLGSTFTTKVLDATDMQLWWANSEELLFLWKNIQVEAYEDKLVFTLPKQLAGQVINNPYDIMILMQVQQEFPDIFPPCRDLKNDLVIGWVKFVKTGTGIVVTEIQSGLESKRKYAWDIHYQMYPSATVTNVVLTEAIRYLVNDSNTKISIVGTAEKRLHGHKIPHDVYSRMLSRNGLIYSPHDRVWKIGRM